MTNSFTIQTLRAAHFTDLGESRPLISIGDSINMAELFSHKANSELYTLSYYVLDEDQVLFNVTLSRIYFD